MRKIRTNPAADGSVFLTTDTWTEETLNLVSHRRWSALSVPKSESRELLPDAEEMRRNVSSPEGTGHHPVTHGNAISCSGRSYEPHCVRIGQEQVC